MIIAFRRYKIKSFLFLLGLLRQKRQIIFSVKIINKIVGKNLNSRFSIEILRKIRFLIRAVMLAVITVNQKSR